MRFTILLLSILLLNVMTFNTSPDTRYDWDQHTDGEDLSISLSNEPAIIFVVFFNKEVEGNEALSKANDSLRNVLKNDLASHDEVVYTEVDMASTNPQLASYTKLAATDMGIDVSLLETGPIVAVMNRGEGSWVHGQGNVVANDKRWGPGKDSFEEILDSIETFIDEAKDRKTGGTGVVPASRNANRAGTVSIGDQGPSY